jgi:hypothetical protein
MSYKIPVRFIIQAKREIPQVELDRFTETVQRLVPIWHYEKAEQNETEIIVTITELERFYVEVESKDKQLLHAMELHLRPHIYLLGM